MTLTLNKRKLNKLLLPVLLLALVVPFISHARGLELSVTPTLFEMSAVPGQTWQSQVKVINTNPHDLTVYANVMNFAPQGESGEGKFVPVFENFTEGSTLAEWIEISKEAYIISPETSKFIPFTVRVPEDASPGGHFAAIMIGTKPPASEGFQVSTSQIVTSLFFARVAGDVIEDGSIREFTAIKKIVQEPAASFLVRFENKGNVHIQPQGQIEIFNMWGKERGIIPINHKTHFGNVLPNSVRKFEFTWKGESSITDIGRYKAVVTLGYGLDKRKFTTSTLYFYVIPVKSLVMVLGGVLFAVWFILWAVKAYVRRMLALSGLDVHADYEHMRRPTLVREGDVLISKQKHKVHAPLINGWTDLVSRLRNVTAITDYFKVMIKFVIHYRLFFGSLVLLFVIIGLAYTFVKEVGKDTKDYEVTIENDDQDVTLSSEDIIYEKEKTAIEEKSVTSETEISTSTIDNVYELDLINAGDMPGAAATLRVQLENLGFTINSISSDFEESRDRTVVIYAVGLEEEALAISKKLGNALLSADPEAENNITVFIGNDFEF